MSKKTKNIDKMESAGQDAFESLYAHGAGDTRELIETLVNSFTIIPVFQCHGDGTVSVTLTSENPEFEQVFTGPTEEVVECMYDWVNEALEYHGADERLEYVKDSLHKQPPCRSAFGRQH